MNDSYAMGKSKKTFDGNRGLSDAEVARFLKGLATIYRDKRTGNRALAEALSRIAEKLGREAYSHTQEKDDNQRSFALELTESELQKLTADAVTNFIADDRKTKLDLIKLAAARFSIPRAKLLRLKLDEVRDAIRASLQHEDSLKIITEQAERNGETRKS